MRVEFHEHVVRQSCLQPERVVLRPRREQLAVHHAREAAEAVVVRGHRRGVGEVIGEGQRDAGLRKRPEGTEEQRNVYCDDDGEEDEPATPAQSIPVRSGRLHLRRNLRGRGGLRGAHPPALFQAPGGTAPPLRSPGWVFIEVASCTTAPPKATAPAAASSQTAWVRARPVTAGNPCRSRSKPSSNSAAPMVAATSTRKGRWRTAATDPAKRAAGAKPSRKPVFPTRLPKARPTGAPK